MRISARTFLLLATAAALPGMASADPWTRLYAERTAAYQLPAPLAAESAALTHGTASEAPPAAEPAPPAAAPAAEAAPPAQTPVTAPVEAAAPAPAAKPVEKAAIPADFMQQANEPVLPHSWEKSDRADPRIARLQILLDRANISPGVIDGRTGRNLSKAVAALQNMYGLPSTGRLGPDVDDILGRFGATPVFVPYVITQADVDGPFVPVMPKDYGEMAKLDRLAYRGPTEELAERFHMDEAFLRRLNPDIDFNTPGSVIIVADVGPNATAKVAHLVADQQARQLIGYDAAWNVVVAYPATIGSTDMPSPTGIHAVKAIAVDPVYWYRPKVNFQQGNNTKSLKLAPGPNNPVGAVWIGLDKPTYGIHGSPEPSKIDKTNSHGCLRLTNWDAKELARLVKPGVDVEFIDPTPTASVAAAHATAAPAAMAEASQPAAMPPPLAQ
ncbi:hypothetical protein C3941_03780 [Kaistia algarum]|uniref:L,D-transpeptidase family protein n=1 Tax=Kaistia algarum TaxID=2083279 RepID=UPI000CE82C01|nr:L,D-transpeptidase [Kaistia algarum]MCX5512667.1 L,D-transpeptidase [Kaistia algarum]PPE81822.1 hypothetical protein C3941_03780 [Kaistia algarum]